MSSQTMWKSGFFFYYCALQPVLPSKKQGDIAAKHKSGEVRERLNRAVSKTVVRISVPWVRTMAPAIETARKALLPPKGARSESFESIPPSPQYGYL